MSSKSEDYESIVSTLVVQLWRDCDLQGTLWNDCMQGTSVKIGSICRCTGIGQLYPVSPVD